MTQLRPYQQAAVDAVYEHLRTRDDNPAVVLPTAGGKSWVIAQLVKDAVLRWNGRVLVLAHVKELLEQNAEKICRLCPDVPIGIYSAGLNRRETDKPVIVAGIQSIYKRACELDAFDLVIVDECFPAGTMISTPRGDVAIEDLTIGQPVYTALGVGKVEAISARPADDLLELEFEDGRILRCTPNHPFFTEWGWREAQALEVGSRLFSREDVQALRNSISSENLHERRRRPEGVSVGDRVECPKVLLGEVQRTGEAETSARSCNETALLEVRQNLLRQENMPMLRQRVPSVGQAGPDGGPHQLHAREKLAQAAVLLDLLRQDGGKCDVGSGSSRTSPSGAQGNWTCTRQTWRERTTHHAADSTSQNTGPRMAIRSGGVRWASASSGNAQQSQNRYCPFRKEDCHRGRWPIASDSCDARSRQEKDVGLASQRVVRITAVKCEGPVAVFNLQISGHPTYYAGGVLAHNCHLIPPDGEGIYRTFLADAKVVNPHLRVIGLTATPFRLSSGPICTPDGILNHICYEVGVRELIRDGYLCPLVTKAGVHKADFGQLHVRGGEFVADEVEDLMDDDRLVIAACSEIVAHTHNRQSVLVFTSGVKHGKHVARVLAEMSGQEVGFLDGQTPTAERTMLVARFRREAMAGLLPQAPLKYLVNVNVLTTGFDAPNIDCVAILRPTMSPGLWYQMCLDMETEVMTPQGWAKCSQVNVGDSVGAFDLATGEIVFCPALDKVHRPLAPGETMYGVSAPHLDIRVTDRHTMVYRGRGETCRHWRKRDARALAALRDSFLVPVAGNTDGPSVPLSDDELRFLGWVLTDGYRDPSNNAVVISQSAAGPYLEQIHSMLKGCGIGYRVYRRERKGKLSQYPPAVQFQIPYGEPRGANRGLRGWKHLADYLNRPLLESLLPISRRQLQVLLEAMNLGDGAKRKSVSWRPRTMDICLGEHQFLAEQLQVLCVLRGFRCNISILRQRSPWHSGDPKPLYVLRVREQQVATIGGSVQRRNPLVKKRSRFGPVPFDPSEMVWCLTTEYGTLVTRRRGKVCIVGNCGRGFRLHPGKQNCLVLDFGGNALRHGPVDQLKMPEAPGRGSGEAPAKECPECHAVIAAGYATCPECGHKFPPPERQKHDTRASEAGILSGQVTDTEYEVHDVRYSVHIKRDAPPDAPQTMRVDYRIGQFTWVSEWVCFEHTGYARWKAEQWWRKRSPDPIPETAERAVEIAEAGGLAITQRIVVRTVAGEKFDRIVGYTLGPMPEPVYSTAAECDLDDVPF